MSKKDKNHKHGDYTDEGLENGEVELEEEKGEDHAMTDESIGKDSSVASATAISGELSDLIREMQPTPSLTKRLSAEIAAAPATTLPDTAGIEEPLPVRRVPVESLGTGVARLLGDAVGEVVKVTTTIGHSVNGRADQVCSPTNSKVTQPADPTKRSIVKNSSAVAGGVQSLVNGVGLVVNGGVSIVTGTLGCLTGAVVCIGKSIVKGVQPHRTPPV
ncbi:MAG: hypothetical protein HQL55_07275 [Magnetococcales bacterium]|nr:hypothetical protein [Magnetococcales bacterium]